MTRLDMGAAHLQGMNEERPEAASRLERALEEITLAIRDLTQQSTSVSIAPRLLNVNEAAQYLNVSRSSVYRMIERGELPPVEVVAKTRLHVDSLDAWIDTHNRKVS